MRIAYITSGAAGMYCGSCMNANTLATALIAQGHDVALVPTYTPMRIDEESVARDRMFFGALNAFLVQKYPLLRRMPRALTWLLDRPALLERLARWSGKGNMDDIGALTLSMLQGEQGPQAPELERLVAWLRDDFKPDIVHLSFTLFLGFARRLKEEIGVPVVSSVQGEEILLDELPDAYRSQIVAEMQRRIADVEAVVAPCSFYAEHMQDLLAVPKEKMRTAPLGIAAEDYARDRAAADRSSSPDRPLVVGFLARACPEKGLDYLIEAFAKLTEQFGRDRLRLRVAGYLSPRDEDYMAAQRQRVRDLGLEDRVTFEGEVDRQAKIDFLRSVDVFSVPTRYHEPKGISLIEALACGVPVVQPHHGAFPEMVQATGGGLLVEPDNVDALTVGLATLLTDEEARRSMARKARAGVLRHHTATAAAERTLAVYRSVL